MAACQVAAQGRVGRRALLLHESRRPSYSHTPAACSNSEEAVYEPLEDNDKAEFHEPLGGEAAVHELPNLLDLTIDEDTLDNEEEAGGKPLHKVSVSAS